MTTSGAGSGIDHAWFLGAYFKEHGGDQSERFIREGTWENGYEDKYIEDVKSIRPGDRVAIKSSYTRKHGLPFDNRGHDVSVMAVKATGIVKDNPGDGRRLSVEWKPLDSPLQWYFWTYRGTVWKVVAGQWHTDNLLRFTFDDEPQDIDRFRNRPYWRDRFGDQPRVTDRFGWSTFYAAFADRLLVHHEDRRPLLAAVHEVSDGLDRPLPLRDRFADGSSGPLRDICPFTTFGLFNRRITYDNRRRIAKSLADVIGVTAPVPESFEGIPILDNRSTWFFPYASKRSASHIDVLWRALSDALEYADNGDSTSRERFADSFDAAIALYGVGRNLTMGLYWARPWYYPPLDNPSCSFIASEMNVGIDKRGLDGTAYLSLRDRLEAAFVDEGSRIHSFPELSASAFTAKRALPEEPAGYERFAEGEEAGDEVRTESDIEGRAESDDGMPYSVDDIIDDGCFLERQKLEMLLSRLESKKNLILQGPPGTGKTWLAKRLAYALIGSKSSHRVRPFQFHPNLSYEDFVRGWRPVGERGLELTDGPLLQAVNDAATDPAGDYVLVIEEINRGNPAQIFGEMLTLLEADKRKPEEAIALSYPKPANERVHIPPNLYVIGTMNVADRSLALVDFALRRRFAFVDLEPTFGDAWRNWMSSELGLPAEFLTDIERRLSRLNGNIADDAVLGPQFRVGHSVVTPASDATIDNPQEWFRQIVETEIAPLLEEYWFDDPGKAREEVKNLLDGVSP